MLGKLSVPVRPTGLDGPIALAVGAVEIVWTFFSLVYLFSSVSPSQGDGPV